MKIFKLSARLGDEVVGGGSVKGPWNASLDMLHSA